MTEPYGVHCPTCGGKDARVLEARGRPRVRSAPASLPFESLRGRDYRAVRGGSAPSCQGHAMDDVRIFLPSARNSHDPARHSGDSLHRASAIRSVHVLVRQVSRVYCLSMPSALLKACSAPGCSQQRRGARGVREQHQVHHPGQVHHPRRQHAGRFHVVQPCHHQSRGVQSLPHRRDKPRGQHPATKSHVQKHHPGPCRSVQQGALHGLPAAVPAQLLPWHLRHVAGDGAQGTRQPVLVLAPQCNACVQ